MNDLNSSGTWRSHDSYLPPMARFRDKLQATFSTQGSKQFKPASQSPSDLKRELQPEMHKLRPQPVMSTSSITFTENTMTPTATFSSREMLGRKDSHTLTVKNLAPLYDIGVCTKEQYCRQKLQSGHCNCSVPDLLAL